MQEGQHVKTHRSRPLSLRHAILLLVVGIDILIVCTGLQAGLLVFRNSRLLLSETIAASLTISSDRLAQSLDSVKSLSDQLYSNPQIQAQLILNKDSGGTVPTYHTLYSLMLNLYQQSSYRLIRSVSLVTDSYTVTCGRDAAGRPADEVLTRLTEQAAGTNGSILIDTSSCGTHGLILYRPVLRIRPFTLDQLGVLVICVDMDVLVGDAVDFSRQYKDSAYLLREGDRELYRSDVLQGLNVSRLAGSGDGSYGSVTLDGRHYLWQKGAVADYGWDYICMVDNDAQQRSMERSLLVFLGVMLLTLLLALLVSGRFARRISRDFTSLIQKMEDFANGALTAPPPQATAVSISEVDVLHLHFDHMAQELTRLINERYASELLSKEMQLRNLEAQMNPHFIYNVLDSINWRARAAHLTDISDIVDALGKYLRVSLNRQCKLITVGEELALVDCYITIQQYRFEEHLSYRCDVPDDLRQIMIPKLVIQPLVENAVKYAVENSMDECCQILVQARLSDAQLFIDVKNSGSELDEGLLGKLKSGKAQPHGFGIGLTNIDERMRLTYGEPYGLQLFNEDGFAVCRLTFPLCHESGPCPPPLPNSAAE